MQTCFLLFAVLGMANAAFMSRNVMSDAKAPDFVSLDECSAAYATAAAKLCELGVKEYCLEQPVTTTTVAPEPEAAPIGKEDIGGVKEREAEEEYLPPSEDGSASRSGWDHKQHGEDWDTGSCKASNQSPVDIQSNVDLQGQTKSLLWFDYYPPHNVKAAPLINNGHTLEFVNPTTTDMGDVKLGKGTYKLKKYEIHAPAEHTIDGHSYPLELQTYHEYQGKVLAVSFIFKDGGDKKNPFLQGLLDAAKGGLPIWKKQTKNTELSPEVVAAFDLDSVVPKSDIHPGGELTFYNYDGSMTSPPCTTGVDWWVIQHPITASKAQLDAIRAAITGSESTPFGNNRKTQALGARHVLVGHTGLQHHTYNTKAAYNKRADLNKTSRGYSSQDMPWGPHWEKGDAAAPAPAPAL